MPNKNDFEARMRTLLLEEQFAKTRKARAEAEAAEIILKATRDNAAAHGVVLPKVPS